MEEKKHGLQMQGRERLMVSGVEDVDSFDDDKVMAYTVDGIMTVRGAELRINRLNVENGEMEVEGIIDGITYEDGHKSGGGFFSKIFK
ncbi:MAG: sporulation protein YabP [Ruminococcaceae bacterium]|nr:sporulation protein YabP [Oscillospiraceae bacterium]